MTRKVIHVAVNGVTGRMGYRQHLVRSLLSIREQGGVQLSDGTVVYPEPVLVGRSEERLRAIAAQHGLDRWTTRLDEVLADPEIEVYFDTQLTSAREASLMKAISAGKHVYTEKPVASSLSGALRLAKAARAAGITHGVVHDKLFLPGMIKLRRLVEAGFFGRVLSVRLEFGYWVFEGDQVAAQRPSWNYRAEDGGGIVLDMFPHWQYLLTDLFGPVSGGVRAERYAHPEAVGRVRAAVRRDRGRRRVRGAGVRQRRGGLGELVVGGPGQPARAARAAGRRDAGQRGGRATALRDPAPRVHADAGVEPGPARPARLPGAMDGRAGQHELRQRVQGRVGAVPGLRWPRADRSPGTWPRGPRACSWPGWRCSPRPRAGGSTCRRWRSEVGASIQLPGREGPLVIPAPGWAAGYPPPVARRVYAAAHVAAVRGPAGEVVDWEATLRFREHLWAHGFGVAEAMDTAQRGMGLSWDLARELIARSASAAHGALACGAGTDQLADGESYPIPRIIDAFASQMAFVQSAGADVILMASRALAASARGPGDYLEVYGSLLQAAERPVILHWLGEAFDPALRGYWGGTDFETAADTVLSLLDRYGDKVDGVKLSVLDAGREVALRRRLPPGVRLYTGDDFGYGELIRGDAQGHSDALLGAFAAITAPAAAALAALDRGDLAGYDAAMAPTVALSRLIFEPPTFYYKVGVAFLAWLNGFQPQFAMLGGLQRQRPARHLIRVFELAAAARALTDPDLAVERMNELLARLVGPERV